MRESQDAADGYVAVAGDEEVFEMQVVMQQSAAKLQSEMDQGKPSRGYLYAAVIAANISAFICGVGIGWTSPEIPQLKGIVNPSGNPLPSPITEDQSSWIGSLLPIGAAIGPFPSGLASDRFGRKLTLLFTALPFLAAFLVFSYCGSVGWFYIGRLLTGLGVGAVFTVLPNYVAEVAEDDVRGAVSSYMQLFITIGLLFAYGLGPYVSIGVFNLICAVPCIIFVTVFFLLAPESPYYLVIRDKEGAEKALRRLRNVEGVEKEFQVIKATVDESLANKASFLDIFKSKGLTKSLIVCLGLLFFQQFSGITIILFYTQTIFLATGSSIPAEICTIIVGIIQFLSSFVAPVFVDRTGKRPLLLFSAAGMFISQAALGFYFHLKDSNTDVSSIFWLPIVSLIGYNLTYCAGFGPLPWAVMGELFPANIKSTASTVSAAFCWLLSFFLTKFFGSITERVGNAGSFWTFGVCCAAAFAFVYWFVPETSGKSLDEIQEMMSGESRRSEDGGKR